ncbi:hypothetical protein O6H91_Y139800 [Diphasiastrum complanatum]|nr:hypothetical protein O6H91_Y139800 [Diphasiastrum complanatum]
MALPIAIATTTTATTPPIWTSACPALRQPQASTCFSMAVSCRFSERADCFPRHFPLAITLPCSFGFESFGKNQSIRLIWKPSTKADNWGYLHLNERQSSHMRAGPRCMAPDEEKMTKRSPLDFPEWDRPSPGRRPDIFPQFSPMKTPLPQPSPTDPPQEDEEEEEKKEEEEDPEKEPEKPEDSLLLFCFPPIFGGMNSQMLWADFK